MVDATYPTAPQKRDIILQLRTTKGNDLWKVQLGDGLFSLYAPSDRLVMMVPIEQATSYLRIHRDLLHGETLRVSMLEGLKFHTFKVSKLDHAELFAWLPRRAPEYLAKEVRLYGVALILLGAGFLIFQEHLDWAWGALLVATGVAAVLDSRPRIYALSGAVLAFIGMMMLFRDAPATPTPLLRLLCTSLGSLILLWAIQQFSLTSPNHQLLTLHDTQRESFSPGERHGSRIVKTVALCAAAFAAVFACYAAGLYWSAGREQALLADYVIFGGLSVLMAFCAAVLFLRRYPPYLEAKITAQMLITVAVLYAWGLAAGFAQGEPFAFSRGILAAGLLRFEQPYVWAPLIVLLLAFHRWFIGAVEREVQRGG